MMNPLKSLVWIYVLSIVILPLMKADGEVVQNETFIETFTLPEIMSISDMMSAVDLVPTLHDPQKCSESSHCNSSLYLQRCSCDGLCGTFNDCCPDIDEYTYLDLSKDLFSCSYVAGIGDMMLIGRCATGWEENTTKSLCEDMPSFNDTLAKIVVSHKSVEGLVYKNMHCALCNYVHDFYYWPAVMECLTINETEIDLNMNSDCHLSLNIPLEYNSYRDCKLHSNDIISDCPVDYNVTSVKQDCEESNTLLVYSNDAVSQFKNKHCAICNGYTEMMDCIPQTSDLGIFRTFSIGQRNTFRMLVDFNDRQTIEISGMGEEVNASFKECNNDQLYDPLSGVCRNIICPGNTEPSGGRCMPVNLTSDSTPSEISNETKQCPLSKVHPSEFEYLNETNQIIFRQRIYNATNYLKNGSDVFLCLNESVRVLSNGRGLQASDKIERYISFVGLIISVISLLITIIFYLVLPDLLNIPGKNLVSLCISLLISQLLFLLSSEASEINVICILVAVLMHYFFLAAFSWMNVIAFDLSRIFSNPTGVSNIRGTPSTRFYIYSVYSWCVPLLLVSVAILFDFAIVNDSVEDFKPHYGQVVCWISSRNALLLFFIGPLALLNFLNIIAFCFVVYHITKTKKQGSLATNKSNSRTFLIYLKLSFVMGLTWVFAFIANFTGNTIMWYLFTIFNTLQGLFISISFICTKKILRLIKSRRRQSTSKATSSATIKSTNSTPVTSRKV